MAEYLNFIFEQISSLKLLVRVVWVGPNADALISRFMGDVERRRSGRSVLFFAWKPSSITEKNELLSVAFPPCETLQSPKSYDMRCPYEIHRFEKIAWSAVKTQATHVFEVPLCRYGFYILNKCIEFFEIFLKSKRDFISEIKSKF